MNENAYANEEEQIDKVKLDEDLTRIEDIVRGAVGYNELRGRCRDRCCIKICPRC